MQVRRVRGQMNHQQREPGKAKGKDAPVTVHHFTAPSNYTGTFHHCISNSSVPPHSNRSSSSTRSFSSMRSSSFTGSTYCNPGNYTSFINHFPGPIHSTNVFTAATMQLYPHNLSGLEIELAMDNLLMAFSLSSLIGSSCFFPQLDYILSSLYRIVYSIWINTQNAVRTYIAFDFAS